MRAVSTGSRLASPRRLTAFYVAAILTLLHPVEIAKDHLSLSG